MSQDPPRLTNMGATELERRLLEAVANERPAPELTQRMGAALGFAAASAGIAANAAAKTVANTVATKTVLAWVSAGVVAVAVTVGVVSVRRAPSRAPARGATTSELAATTPAAVEPLPAQDVSRVASRPSAPAAMGLDRTVRPPASERAAARPIAIARRHATLTASTPDLRDEIALIDAARGAIKTGAADRALVLLRRYTIAYAAGTFRPEAEALRIEALAQIGQTARARTLARDFVAKHPNSPLADRVAHIARSGPGG